MDDKCYRCGIELKPLSEIALQDILDMTLFYRERFPNTWDDPEDKVRVCDICDEEIETIETAEQYEMRKIIEG